MAIDYKAILKDQTYAASAKADPTKGQNFARFGDYLLEVQATSKTVKQQGKADFKVLESRKTEANEPNSVGDCFSTYDSLVNVDDGGPARWKTFCFTTTGLPLSFFDELEVQDGTKTVVLTGAQANQVWLNHLNDEKKQPLAFMPVRCVAKSVAGKVYTRMQFSSAFTPEMIPAIDAKRAAAGLCSLEEAMKF